MSASPGKDPEKSEKGSPAAEHNDDQGEPGHIEADDDGIADEDEFLAVGWDASSSAASTSVSSSVYRHEYDHGRRYHAYKHGRYPIPNDDQEQNREDMKHALVLELTDGKLFYAPIGKEPQKILDLGTGTGIWAMAMADLYPGAEVLGVDLSPIQPPWVPPNLRFVIDDIEDEWVYGSGWDFVHLRHMAVVLQKTQDTIEKVFAHLRPGGWVEFQETNGLPLCDDGTMKEDDIMCRYYETCMEAMATFGMDIRKGLALGSDLEQAGFVNIQCVTKRVPMGPWARDKTLRLIGQYARLATLDGIESVVGKPFAALGISEEEQVVWLAKLRQSLMDDSVHRYYNFYFWYGQKPDPPGV